MFKSRISTTLSTIGTHDYYGMYFDATNNNRINCGSSSTLDAGTSDFTISAWFKPTETKRSGQYWPIVSKGHSLTGTGDVTGWALSWVDEDDGNPNEAIYFDRVDTGGDGSDRDTAIGYNVSNINQWTHAVGVYNTTDDNLKVYINGALKDTQSDEDSTNTGDGSRTFYIGNDEASRDFEGWISEVAFYKSALTAAQVLTIYNGGDIYNHSLGPDPSNLKGWWRCGNGSPTLRFNGEVIKDLSGNSNDGTIENMGFSK